MPRPGSPRTEEGNRRTSLLPCCTGLLLALALVMPPAARAQQWVGADARSVSMGNAGVAVSRGPSALHWNPAALAADRRRFAVHINGIADLQIEGDAVRRTDRLARLLDDFPLDDIQGRFDEARVTEADIRHTFHIIDAIADLLEPGTGAGAHVGGDLSVQHGAWAFAYRRISHPGLVAVLDTGPDSGLALADDGLEDLNRGLRDLVEERIAAGATLHQPATAAGRDLSRQLRDIAAGQGIFIPQEASDEFAFQGEAALGDDLGDVRLLDLVEDVLAATALATDARVGVLADNRSGAEIRGLTLHELSLGRGLELPLPGPKVRIGASVRLLYGETFIRRFTLREIDGGVKLIGEVFDSFSQRTKTGVRVTADASVMVDPVPWLTLAISGRNLAPVAFDFSDGREFALDPQVRGGLTIRPRSWLTLALDMDITRNRSDALPGISWQQAGVGMEIAAGWRRLRWALRGGVWTDLGDSGIDAVYTAGVELGSGEWFVALSGYVTGHNVDVESASVNASADDFPERAGVNLSVGFGF